MRLIATLVAAVLLGGCEGARDDATARQELARANAAYDAALIAGDAAALDRLYADDFQLIRSDAQVSDKDEQIRLMTQQIDLIEGKSDQVRTVMLGPDAALMSGRLTGRFRADGKVESFVERYSALWVREGGAWKVKHEHSSIAP
jgi:ketosteroid isomerase-like protein